MKIKKLTRERKKQNAIPLMKVHIPPSAIKPLLKVLDSGYVSEGDVSHEFERRFQKYIGNPYTALVNSGTSALMLAVRMAGVGPGDEVISTPMTCLATNEPIILAGARVVWADIDRRTGNTDPLSVEKRITPKTKAIMVVHWAGNPVDLSPISAVARKHTIPVIEDAAHAIGSAYHGKRIGSHSDFVCFSFQAVKNLTTVDGGALAVKNKKMYERAKLLRWYGCARSHTKNPIKWIGDVMEPGYKMHMNDMNASIGIEQLKYVDRLVDRHRENAAYLSEKLKDVDEIELPLVTSRAKSSFWLYTLKLPHPQFREKFSEALRKKGIGNGIVHMRNDTYSLFKNFRRDDLPGVDDFCSRMLNIPCGWWLSKSDCAYVVRSIKESVKESL
ncbi:MAG: DegT/DnrJ/EryC1/StrS family aminotransferase [Candidatus Colwellbacteria bacterium]|nr:DegT/DnrJ/EryC1/StrS family aminotransferase [Candidatus Colwellbacteria bacterium]